MKKMVTIQKWLKPMKRFQQNSLSHNYFIVFFLILCGCVEENESQVITTQAELKTTKSAAAVQSVSTKSTPTYNFVNVNETVSDVSSPFSAWQITKQYPQFTVMSGNIATDKINQSILLLVKQLQCPNKGDFSFSAQVTEINEKHISIKYESSWMCPSMPRPDSHVGGITWQAQTGQRLYLKDFFASENDEAMHEQLLQKLKAFLPTKCSKFVKIDQFYVKGGRVVLINHNSNWEPACNQEIEISK